MGVSTSLLPFPRLLDWLAVMSSTSPMIKLGAIYTLSSTARMVGTRLWFIDHADAVHLYDAALCGCISILQGCATPMSRYSASASVMQ